MVDRLRGASAPSDCGEWQLDKNDFCVANDSRNGSSSREVPGLHGAAIIGVRIYRVDPDKVKASLVERGREPAGAGEFAEAGGATAQDMTFAEP